LYPVRASTSATDTTYCSHLVVTVWSLGIHTAMARVWASGVASLFGSTSTTFHTAAGTVISGLVPTAFRSPNRPVPPWPCGPHAMYSSFPSRASLRQYSSSNRQPFWLHSGDCGTTLVM
jgi:hypothetical protein